MIEILCRNFLSDFVSKKKGNNKIIIELKKIADKDKLIQNIIVLKNIMSVVFQIAMCVSFTLLNV